MWGYGYLIVVIYRYLLLVVALRRTQNFQVRWCAMHVLSRRIETLVRDGDLDMTFTWHKFYGSTCRLAEPLSLWIPCNTRCYITTSTVWTSLKILIHLIPAWLLLLSWLPSLLNLPGQATGTGDAFQLVLVATLEQCNTATSEPRTRHGTSMTHDMTWSWVMSDMGMS